jgi:hypothetical protein
MPRRITSGSFVDDVVLDIKDASDDGSRQYRPHVKTRTRKRQSEAAWAKLTEFEKTIDEQDGPRTEKQEEKVVKMACDLLDLLLMPMSDDALPAGEMLYRDWLAELTPEGYIADRLAKALGVEDEEPNPT